MKTILLALFVSTGIGTHAQKCGASFNFQLGYARGGLKTIAPDPIGGGRLNFFFKPAWQLPLYTGFELASERTLAKTSMFKAPSMGGYELFKAKTSQRILSALITVRLSVPDEKALVRPFVEGLFGGSRLRTATRVWKQAGTDYESAGVNNSRRGDWALSYGAAAGFDLRLNERGSCYLEVKAAYFEGARAKYLANPFTLADGSVRFSTPKTTINQIIPQAGLRFNFN